MTTYLQTKDEQKIPCKSRLQFQNSVFRKIRYSVNLVQMLFIARLKVSFINVQERNSLFGSQDSRLNQNFGNLFAVVCFPLQVRPLFFVKDVGHSINLVQKCFIGVPLQRYIFSELLVKLFVEHTAVAHELSVVQVGVPFQGKLILGEQRKHVDVRQVVILRLLDGARNDTGRVVDKPIGLKGKSKNNNFHSCKQLFAKCCKKKFVKTSGRIYEMPLAA